MVTTAKQRIGLPQKILLRPNETPDQAFLRLAREQISDCLDRIETAANAADTFDHAFVRLLCYVTCNQLRASLAWLAGIQLQDAYADTTSDTPNRR